jgi:hypothetical protein
MLTGLLGGTPWPYYRDMLGWAIRQDAGGFTLRLGGEVAQSQLSSVGTSSPFPVPETRWCGGDGRDQQGSDC